MKYVLHGTEKIVLPEWKDRTSPVTRKRILRMEFCRKSTFDLDLMFLRNHAFGGANENAVVHWDSSNTSMPEIVALLAIGSNVRFSFPWGLGFRCRKVFVIS